MVVLSVLCIVMMGFGFGLYLGWMAELSYLFLGIIGAIGTVLFFVGEFVYEKEKAGLMNELNHLSIKIPICPKCGKQVPEGNFAFCPFCGASLKP